MSYHEVGHALVTALAEEHRAGTEDHDCSAYDGCARLHHCRRRRRRSILQTKDELLAEDYALTWQDVQRRSSYSSSVTSGAANDIEQATAIARAMVTQYGMSDKFGMMGLATVENQYLDNRAGPESAVRRRRPQIDKEVLAHYQSQHMMRRNVSSRRTGRCSIRSQNTSTSMRRSPVRNL